MNCFDMQKQFVGLLYGHLGPNEASQLEEHLASCAACQREYGTLKQLRQSLDLVPVPALQIDLPRLYRQAAECQTRRVRYWRCAAGLLVAVAATLAVIAVGLRLEIHVGSDQVVLRWGPGSATPAMEPPARAPRIASPTRLQTEPKFPSAAEEQIRFLNELVHALADDVQSRDRRQQQELARVQNQLRDIERQSTRYWTATQRDVTALYTAQFELPKKGTTP